MKFSNGCHNFVIMYVVAIIIVVCNRGNASDNTKTAESCVGSRLELRCPLTKIIKEIKIYHGISKCKGNSCCIEDVGCSHDPNEARVTFVRNRCQGEQHCSVDIQSVDATPCTWGWWTGKRTIDGDPFERITYICEVDPRTSTYATSTKINNDVETDNTTRPTPNEDESNTHNVTSTEETSKNDYNKTGGKGKATLPVVMGIICLIILVAIVALVVFMCRSKYCSQAKLFQPVAMTKIKNNQNENAIYANEIQESSLHTNSRSADEAGASQTDEEDTTVYSEVRQRKLGWTEGQRDRATTNKTPTTQSDVYAVVNKPSKTTPTSSVVKTDVVEREGLANNGDQVYSLASDDNAEDIYANEPTIQSTGTVSKVPMPQDDGSTTVIENELYGH